MAKIIATQTVMHGALKLRRGDSAEVSDATAAALVKAGLATLATKPAPPAPPKMTPPPANKMAVAPPENKAAPPPRPAPPPIQHT
jgi:hypothetical protein